MGASAYIGRVGGLAVALGVGAAVATGHGVAWAGPTDSNTSSSESASSPDSNADSGTGAADTGTAEAPKTTTTADPPPGASAPSRPKLGSKAKDVMSSLTRAAERGVAVATGGALTSKKFKPQKAAAPVEPKQAATDDAAPAEGAQLDEAQPEVAQAPEAVTAPEVVKVRPAQKKSAAVPTDNPVERFVRHLPAAQPSHPARTEQRTTAQVVAESVETAVAPAAETVERSTFQTLSVNTAMQEYLPVLTAASAPAPEKPPVPRLLSTIVSALGLGALASNTPAGPIGTPIALALLALGVRREQAALTVGSSSTVRTPTVAALTIAESQPTGAVVTPYDPATDYSVNPVAVSPNTAIITKLTGPGGLNNTQSRFGIGGTDLGIMWDNGIDEQNQVLILFGDTFYNTTPVRTGVWRNNTLLRSSDAMLSNGIYVRDGHPVDDFAGAPLVYNSELQRYIFKQVVANERYAVGQDITIIPTSAISAPYPNQYGSRQYASIMSVRSWDTPGRWTTNYSAIAFSDDNGETWHVARESVRPAAVGRSTMPYVAGNENFQQFAFVAPPAGSADADAGWVYAYGTPSGRGGTVYLSRVKQDQILDQTKYEYWNGTAWVANKPSAAKPVLPGTTTSYFFGLIKRTTYPTAGEMSVQYNEYEKQYIMLYQDQNNNIVMRKADRPEGPWSTPTVLVSSSKMPGLYAPMIHPWSSTSKVDESERQYLYWNMSTWGDYQVVTMRTDLSKV